MPEGRKAKANQAFLSIRVQPGWAVGGTKRSKASGTDRAGERAGCGQATGLGALLPLQPERQERADARKFQVLVHSPIPINMAQPW